MKNYLQNFQAVSLMALSLLAASCADKQQAKTDTNNSNIAKSKAIDLANFDQTVKPQDDFYLYVNGNWAKNNPIPATESRWGSFNELNERNRAILVQIVNEATGKKAEKGSNWQMVGDFYLSGMDTVKIEQAGLTPLRGELDAIAAIKDKNGVMETIARFHRMSMGSLFTFFVNADRKNSTRYAAYASQGGLGLPERSYYLEDNFAEKRKQYVAHVAKMLELSGENAATAQKQAEQILALETELAKVSRERAALRDLERSYNKKTVAELETLAPAMGWSKYLSGIGAGAAKEVIVGQPEFFQGINKQLDATPIDAWKAYLRWNLLRSAAAGLPKAFADESFNFYAKQLRGIQVMKPRSQRVQELTSAYLGEPLGQLYVERAFSPKAKARAEEMIGYIRKAFADHINNLDWMSAATKEQALKKLNAIVYKIGYPDKWRSYKGLEISRESYLTNQLNVSKFEFERRAKRVGQEVDRSEWFMSPQTVNAYYNSTMNEIVFPAAILQAPFFDANADDAVNFGGIGAVIGHELTHGFDDQGSKFDGDGNMKNWWTKEDSTRFAERTQILVNQFNNYKVLDNVSINGKLTLGENIADLGGIAIAYDGLKKALADKGGNLKSPLIDGFTPEQRFFINWAQVWRTNFRPQALQEYIKTDPHAPGQFRAIAPLSNMPSFFDAFGVKEGDKMRRSEAERVIIW